MIYEFKADDIVYEPYKPRKYGKVLSVSHNGRYQVCLVRWKDGSESEVGNLWLESLNELVKDHERKLATHVANLEKANKL